jgi:hypothetical protein
MGFFLKPAFRYRLRVLIPVRLWVLLLVGMTSVLAGLALCSSALALSSVNVPLDNWSYDALDKLQGFGLIQSDIYSMRPYTRLEFARLVNEAISAEAYKEKKLPPLINHLLEKFQLEFRSELEEVTTEPVKTSTFFKPAQELQARYAYVAGDPRQFTGFPKDRNFKINATDGTPLFPNNEGINYTQHYNFSFQVASSARLWDDVSLYAEPVFILRENKTNIDNEDHAAVDLHTGYAKVSQWNVEIEAGRDSMWWGQGYHGTLLLSNNAPPLDMLKLSNPNPTVLPWYFSYLGLFKYTIFCARLEEDRDFPHALLGGAHLAFKPHPLFEFGVTGTLLFGGEGAPNPGIPGGGGQEDGLMSFDARLKIPFLRNAELYAEYGGEDTQSTRWYEFVFRDVAYLLGIYFPKIFDDGRTDLRIEYANNAFKQSFPSHVGFWYGHGIYTSGYTFDRMILGHAMGPDASDFFVRSTHYLSDKWRLGLDYDNMENGLTLAKVVERTNAAGLDITYDVNSWLSISGRYVHGFVSNYNMLKGIDQTDQVFVFTLKALL